MNKSFYITTTTIILIAFVFCSVFLIGLDNTTGIECIDKFSPYADTDAINRVSNICVLMISGTFLNNTVNMVFSIICILLSAYLLFLVMKKTITTELSLLMSCLYLALVSLGAYSFELGAVTCLLSAFLVYIYYLKYDGLIKWYIMLITLSILAIHYKVFLIALYLFPFFSYSRIKKLKNAWTGFVNMIVLFILAFVLYHRFVFVFPLNISSVKPLGYYTFFNELTFEKCVMLFMFIFSASSTLFNKKTIKGYIKFSTIYTFLYVLSFIYFYGSRASFITFLPPVFASMAITLCHLRVMRENKKVLILVITCITLIIFTALFIFN